MTHKLTSFGGQYRCPNCDRIWDADDLPPDDEECDQSRTSYTKRFGVKKSRK